MCDWGVSLFNVFLFDLDDVWPWWKSALCISQVKVGSWSLFQVLSWSNNTPDHTVPHYESKTDSLELSVGTIFWYVIIVILDHVINDFTDHQINQPLWTSFMVNTWDHHITSFITLYFLSFKNSFGSCKCGNFSLTTRPHSFLCRLMSLLNPWHHFLMESITLQTNNTNHQHTLCTLHANICKCKLTYNSTDCVNRKKLWRIN